MSSVFPVYIVHSRLSSKGKSAAKTPFNTRKPKSGGVANASAGNITMSRRQELPGE